MNKIDMFDLMKDMDTNNDNQRMCDNLAEIINLIDQISENNAKKGNEEKYHLICVHLAHLHGALEDKKLFFKKLENGRSFIIDSKSLKKVKNGEHPDYLRENYKDSNIH